MVQRRDTAKAKRPAGRTTSGAAAAAPVKPRAGASQGASGRSATATGGAAAGGAEAEALRARVADLERQLTVAQSRVADLEQLRAQALNRIDWAIDSLHNVLEGDV